MKRIDKLIEAVEKGADPGFLIERETKQEYQGDIDVSRCTAALVEQGFFLVDKRNIGSPIGEIQTLVQGDLTVTLYEDGTWEASEGPDEAQGNSCLDLLTDRWPDIVFD